MIHHFFIWFTSCSLVIFCYSIFSSISYLFSFVLKIHERWDETVFSRLFHFWTIELARKEMRTREREREWTREVAAIQTNRMAQNSVFDRYGFPSIAFVFSLLSSSSLSLSLLPMDLIGFFLLYFSLFRSNNLMGVNENNGKYVTRMTI